MSILAKAIQFAATKHIEQTDKGGKAYILHPLRIMIKLNSTDDELMAIAVLHDVVEDCNVSFDDLRLIGMTERVILGVHSLTRLSEESYPQFIDRLCLNKDAAIVKRYDLLDNLDASRLEEITNNDSAKLSKYITALRKIDAILK